MTTPIVSRPTRQIFRPHPGQQAKFLACTADIGIYGGAAGGGKSYGLILDPMRFINRPGFGGTIFRLTYPEITGQGGLWETSEKICPYLGGVPRYSDLEWYWPRTGVTIRFGHMQHEKDKLKIQGGAIPYIGVDELTHFSRGKFFYMVSRNRLMADCGVRPYLRATCNPDSGSWVRAFIDWWIDPATGFPIPERDGVLRYFVMDGDTIIWADTEQELIKYCVKLDDGSFLRPKSVTFIAAQLKDNPTLMRQDPQYQANLASLPMFERLQLLGGNWNVRPIAGMFFRRTWFDIVDVAPIGGQIVRYWDRAATEATPRTNPDWTAGVKMLMMPDKTCYVLNVIRFRGRPMEVMKSIKNTAAQDGREVQVWLEEDPGQAGKMDVAVLARELAGYQVYANRVTLDKVTRAKPVSAYSEQGNVKLVRAAWNEAFLSELEGFCDEKQLPVELKVEDVKKDQVDAFSGAFNVLTSRPTPRIY